MAEIVSIPMEFKKETKGTVVYENVEGEVTSIYIRKSAFPSGQYPKAIQLIIQD